MSPEELPAREAMEFDVVIVGAGPAGLAAAIRLRQLAPETSVVVVEKGSEVGAHILSGAVIDPIALDRLIPDWRGEDSPIKTTVSDDRFYWLSATRAVQLPNFMMPPLMSNHGNYVVSLGDVCRWLAGKAEALGVEIYPGFAAAELLFDGNGRGWMIDFDRGRMRIPATHWREANLDRLLRSLLKLRGERASGEVEADFARLRRAYDLAWKRGC